MKRTDHHDLRGLQRLAHCARLAAVLALGLVAFQVAQAQTVVDPAYDRFRGVITGNSIAVGYGSNGTALAVPKSMAMGHVATGLSPTAAEMSRYAALNTKYGQVPFRAAQTVSLARMAKGVSALAGGPLGIGLYALSETASWLQGAGYQFGTDGTLKDVDPATAPPPGYNGKEYRNQQSAGILYPNSPWRKSYSLACTAFRDYLNSIEGTRSASVRRVYAVGACSTTSVTLSCTMYQGGAACTAVGDTLQNRTDPTPPTPTYIPVTDFAAIEGRLNAVPRTQAQTEKLLSELVKYPEVTPDPTVSPSVGPVTAGQTIKSPTSTSTKTTTNTDGSQTTETTECYVKGTPSGASLALSEVCTTQVVNTSPSGSITGTSTAVVESGQPEDTTPQEDESDFCASLVGKLVCADLDTPDGDEVPTASETVSYATESHFGGGSCPADAAMTLHNGQQLTVWDWAQSCAKINQWFRPIFLALCAFTALMIVGPGIKEGA